VPPSVVVRLSPATVPQGATSFHQTTNVCLALWEAEQPHTPMTGEHQTDSWILRSCSCLAADKTMTRDRLHCLRGPTDDWGFHENQSLAGTCTFAPAAALTRSVVVLSRVGTHV